MAEPTPTRAEAPPIRTAGPDLPARTGRTEQVATGLARAAAMIAVLTLMARLVGFGRTIVFADTVRTAGVGAVYNSVNAVPNVLYEVAAGGVLAAVAVPLIGRYLGAGDTAAAHRTTDALLTWCLAILVPVTLLVVLLAPAIAQWLVDDRSAGGQQAGTMMLRVFALQIPLYGVGIVLTGLLHAHRRFFTVALAPLLSSVVVICGYLGYGALANGRSVPAEVPSGALALLAWSTTAAVAALTLPLVVPALRTGWRYHPTWRLSPSDRRRVGSLTSAGLVALAAQQLAVVTTIWIANHRGGGGAQTVYTYVQAVYLLPYALCAVPIATTTFPALARARGADDAALSASARTLAGASRAIATLTGLGACALIAGATAVQGFFVALDARRGHGQISGDAVTVLAPALTAYAPGLIGFGLIALLTRALYVRGRPRVAGLVVAVGWLIAALLPLALLADASGPRVALQRLGWSSSLGLTLAAAGLVALVRQAWGAEAVAGLVRTVATVLVGGFFAALVGRAVADRFDPATLIGWVGQGLAAGAVAAGVLLLVVEFADRGALEPVWRRVRPRRRGRVRRVR